MLEVTHNAATLPFRYKVKVRNLGAAKKSIEQLMAEKRGRGLRLRHNYEPFKSLVYLETRGSFQLKEAIAALRRSGNILSISNNFRPLVADQDQ